MRQDVAYPSSQSAASKTHAPASGISGASPITALSIEFVAKPQEARLVTVVTLWTGSERVKCCRENVRWVNALLAPYLDRRIRVQTMVAHLPVIRPEINAARECFAMQNLPSEDETACVA